MTAPALAALRDPCDVCRFDGEHYTDLDIDGTLRSNPYRWEWLTEGVSPAVLDSVDDLAAAAAAVLAGLDGPTGRAARLDAAHVVGHALHVAGRSLADLGALTNHAGGTVAGLFTSHGGVPKLPQEVVRIGYRGVDGDRQAARQHHGRVWQALCLYSADLVNALAAEGHPIAPGRTGENVSVRGVDWSNVRPGVQLRIGDVLAEVTSYSTPCTKNAQWFVDCDFQRIDHDRHPGWSRVYASVLEDGVVRVGDQVTLEP